MPEPMTADASALRVQHDEMAARVASRQSIVHFAHAAVSAFIGLILLGAAGKLWWDYWSANPEWALSAGSVAGVLLSYAAAQLLFGRHDRAIEARDYASLQALRHQLKLDDPASLLP